MPINEIPRKINGKTVIFNCVDDTLPQVVTAPNGLSNFQDFLQNRSANSINSSGISGGKYGALFGFLKFGTGDYFTGA